MEEDEDEAAASAARWSEVGGEERRRRCSQRGIRHNFDERDNEGGQAAGGGLLSPLECNSPSEQKFQSCKWKESVKR